MSPLLNAGDFRHCYIYQLIFTGTSGSLLLTSFISTMFVWVLNERQCFLEATGFFLLNQTKVWLPSLSYNHFILFITPFYNICKYLNTTVKQKVRLTWSLFCCKAPFTSQDDTNSQNDKKNLQSLPLNKAVNTYVITSDHFIFVVLAESAAAFMYRGNIWHSSLTA